MIKTHDIFVAYAGPDRSLAAKLVDEIRGRNATAAGDGSLHPDDSFESAVPQLIESSRVFAPIVSAATWNGQHYASEELAEAIEYARRGAVAIVPVWLEEMKIEARPHGIARKVGVTLLDHSGCLGCVAGRLIMVALRVQLAESVRTTSMAIEPSGRRRAPIPEQNRSERRQAHQP